MAEDKKVVLIYTDWIENFESLEDAEAGRLVKHLFRYVNDLNPEAPDRITELSFIPLRQQLKRDLEKWEQTLIGRSNAGKASAEARKKKGTKATDVHFVENISTEANKAEQGLTNSTVTVKDTVKVNDILLFNNNNNEKHPLQILIESKFSNVASLKNQLTAEEAFKIENKFSKEIIKQVLEGMENKKDLTKKYVSVYLTLNKWCENQKPALPAANENQSRIERLKNL